MQADQAQADNIPAPEPTVEPRAELNAATRPAIASSLDNRTTQSRETNAHTLHVTNEGDADDVPFQGTDLPREGTKFDDAIKFVEAMRRYGHERGFNVMKDGKVFNARHPHPEDARRNGSIWRCNLYCNFKIKSDSSDTRLRSMCPWSVKFAYSKKAKSYVVVSVANEHNHVTAPVHELVSLLRAKKQWPEYVEHTWQQHVAATVRTPHCVTLASDDEWHVSITTEHRSALSVVTTTTTTHIVMRHDAAHGGIPTCNCATFQTLFIPCSCICSVLQHTKKVVFAIANLHSRWHLTSHALYDAALQRIEDDADLIGAPRMLPTNDLVPSPVPGLFFSKDEYDAIDVPEDPAQRLLQLRAAFGNVEAAIYTDENLCRLLQHTLARFATAIREQTHEADETQRSATATERTTSTKPPATKRQKSNSFLV
ncbi:hypothetical protein SPRG_10579 [Saprolegnia parasitica CBS 223.65]|uniref:SWIM-type domain-containing protein n=1 Tax=Saprolegnia parasitica (strain CBS 223.65) TaxID=695850 RepID=A0A067CBH8_SAPPC|nr:hypothetical protein SPRG_10579 [Saprolegnia parasitica CBS 223.65]KDO24152.1 hypothetical protein SPRG_10579 [Saprolegnia parasitica CBS 223.65]|eukprot:XP_012205096.1 hypothetical protein SPRG_10579 [Saprolegnia parasitica CBS 223.65]